MNNLNIKNSTSFQVNYDIFFQVWTILLNNEKKLNNETIINLLLTNNEEIKNYNKRFRGVNKITDVLSFPCKNDHFLGDIMINIEIIYEQDKNNIENKLKIIFLHSVLHLLGYDHIATKDRKFMHKIEDKYKKLILEDY